MSAIVLSVKYIDGSEKPFSVQWYVSVADFAGS
jgi:hypothetical protein